MSKTEALAKSYAGVRGFVGRTGGWIYSPDGRPVAHGWAAFTTLLIHRRRIVVTGSGSLAIDWRVDDVEGPLR